MGQRLQVDTTAGARYSPFGLNHYANPMRNKSVGKTQLKRAAKGGKTKAALYREIIFREAIYEGGLRAIVDIREGCLNPSGRPISYLESLRLAQQLRKIPIEHEVGFHPLLFSILAHPTWYNFQPLANRLTEDGFHYVHLSESKSNEPERTRHLQKEQHRKCLECEPKCNVP